MLDTNKLINEYKLLKTHMQICELINTLDIMRDQKSLSCSKQFMYRVNANEEGGE